MDLNMFQPRHKVVSAGRILSPCFRLTRNDALPNASNWEADLGGNVEHLTDLLYETSPLEAERLHAVYVARSNIKRAVRRLKAARKISGDELVEAYAAKCWYTRQYVVWIKRLFFEKRPVIAWRRTYVGRRLVRRKKLRKITRHVRIIRYFQTYRIFRKRGVIFKKRLVTKRITYIRKHWDWYFEWHNVYTGFKKPRIIRYKRYIRAVREPQIGAVRKFDFAMYRRYKRYDLRSDIEASYRVQHALVELQNAREAAQVAQRTWEQTPHSKFNRMRHTESTSAYRRTAGVFVGQSGLTLPTTSIGSDSIPMPAGLEWLAQRYRYLGSVTPSGCSVLVESDCPEINSGLFDSDDDYYRQRFCVAGWFVKQYAVWHTEYTNPHGPILLADTEAGFGQLPLYIDEVTRSQPRTVISTIHGDDSSTLSKLRECALDNALAISSGDVGPRDDGFNIYRSVAELKDAEQTITQVRELRSFAAAAPDALRAAGTMPGDVAARLIALGRKCPRVIRGCLYTAASGYCAWKFAIQPTASDIKRVLNDWKDAMFGVRRSLRQMLRLLTPRLSNQITLRKVSRFETPMPNGLSQPVRNKLMFDLVSFMAYEAERGSLHLVDTTGHGLDAATGWGNYSHTLPQQIVRSISRIFGALTSPGYRVYTAGKYKVTSFITKPLSEVYKLALEDIQDVRDIATHAHEALRLQETVWELIPLSFVLNWFIQTGKAATNVQRLVNASLGGTLNWRDDIWHTYRLVGIKYRALATTSYASADRGSLRVYGDRWVTITVRSKQNVESQPVYKCSIPTVLHLECGNVVSAFSTSNAIHGYCKVRDVARGPLADARELTPILFPKAKVRLDRGKLMSLSSMILSALTGRKVSQS